MRRPASFLSLILAAVVGLASCSDVTEPVAGPDEPGATHPGLSASLSATEVAKLLASDGAAGDFFGNFVAVDGDVAMIGASGDDNENGTRAGAAYVFQRSGEAGAWNEVTKLLASDGAAGDLFGAPVALDGDAAVMGASGDDDNGGGAGAAYVFEGSGGSWAEATKLLASDGAAGDAFGESVALDGDVAVVGAFGDDDNGTRSGSAYVFERSGGIWTEVTKLLASDGAAEDEFGRPVAVDGDVVVVGAPKDDDNGTDSGSAYVFERSGGTWTEVTKLVASDGAAGDLFHVVAVDDDVAMIGATEDDNENGPRAGATYVFERSGGTWTEVAKLLASDGAAGDIFGNYVALDGDVTVIGARGVDVNFQMSAGAAYVFERSGGSWTEAAKLTASDGAANDFFGNSVAVSRDVAVVGAFGDDDNGLNAGSSYVFDFEEIVQVVIDIKPGGDPNSINCAASEAPIPVAILSTQESSDEPRDFDATTVDHTTVTFEGASEFHVRGRSGEPIRHEKDVDDDGDTDLIFHFRLGDTDLTCSSTEGTLMGETFEGAAIGGTDAVRMVEGG